jgi:hypothetical protein
MKFLELLKTLVLKMHFQICRANIISMILSALKRQLGLQKNFAY